MNGASQRKSHSSNEAGFKIKKPLRNEAAFFIQRINTYNFLILIFLNHTL